MARIRRPLTDRAAAVDLFEQSARAASTDEFDVGAFVFAAFVEDAAAVVAAVAAVVAAAPFRHMETPTGTMSVAMTCCGDLGWTSDAHGYRYAAQDPTTKKPWPALPQTLQALANSAASSAGYPDFAPNSCLINQYVPGASMSLHQDRNEGDFSAPIVSVSLGLPAVFLWGGLQRADPVRRMRLEHGDVVVWGGPSRLRFHGVAPLQDGLHSVVGRRRLNLTFRSVASSALRSSTSSSG